MITTNNVMEFMQKQAFDTMPLVGAGAGALTGGKMLNGLTPIGLKNRSALFSVLPALLGTGIGGGLGLMGGTAASNAIGKVDMDAVGKQMRREVNDLRVKAAPQGIYRTEDGINIKI